ncbi:MAG: hypothetical protein ABIM89_13845, partial [Mycobacteriales bacterium]
IPVWPGFGPATFGPTVNPATGKPYTWAADGFEATAYRLSTDQYGTQLDPPAHWAPEYPAIDELPGPSSTTGRTRAEPPPAAPAPHAAGAGRSARQRVQLEQPTAMLSLQCR